MVKLEIENRGGLGWKMYFSIPSPLKEKEQNKLIIRINKILEKIIPKWLSSSLIKE